LPKPKSEDDSDEAELGKPWNKPKIPNLPNIPNLPKIPKWPKSEDNAVEEESWQA